MTAVEALTRSLVNKFLHPPMQALKQAARENDAGRLESLCETWSLPAGAQNHETEKAEEAPVNESSGEIRP
jgi:glutamyl-tRNA reductase